MNNLDRAIEQANYDLLIALVENSGNDHIIGYNKGYIEALEYVRDETDWLQK